MPLKPSRRSLFRALGLGSFVALTEKNHPAARQLAAAAAPACALVPASKWIGVDVAGVKRWIPMFVVALLLAAVGASSCSSPAAAASPLPAMLDQVDAGGAAAADVVALAKVDDSGQLVRSFNVASAEPTGDDENFSVRVTLGPVPPLGQLYLLATLSDARVGFTADMGQAVGGPVFVDLAVESGHTSGFYLAIFASP